MLCTTANQRPDYYIGVHAQLEFHACVADSASSKNFYWHEVHADARGEVCLGGEDEQRISPTTRGAINPLTELAQCQEMSHKYSTDGQAKKIVEEKLNEDNLISKRR